jgi:hypothetical protein
LARLFAPLSLTLLRYSMEDDENATEYWRERAAIMEIDGGLKRWQAEFYAVAQTWRYCQRFGKVEPKTVYYRLQVRGIDWESPVEPGEKTD